VSVIAHLWQSTLFVAAIAVVAFLMRRSAARTRHALWLLASIKFIVPFSIVTLAGGALGAWTLPLVGSQGAAAARWLERSRPFWTLDVASPSGTSFLTGLTGLTSIASFLVWAVWIGGSLALLVWRVRQWRLMARAAREALPINDGREVEALRSVAQRAGFTGVQLRQICGNQEPAVVGIRRATILWPEGLGTRLTDDELEAVFAHELCHVARRDNLSSLVQVAVEVLFWFHPMVWWLSGRLVHEREHACDEEVVQMGTDKANYAAGILKVCGFCLRAPAAFAAGIGSSDLAQRVERILGEPSPRARAARLIVPAIGALMLAAPLAAGVLNAHGQATAQETVYKPGNGVSQPKLVKEEKPKYTAKAMQEKIQGSLSLSAIVRADGTVGDVKVTRSLDKVHGLDVEAVNTLKKWRFDPGMKDGKPVAVEIEVEMSFKLK
jgi:bla regulator protein blaR1